MSKTFSTLDLFESENNYNGYILGVQGNPLINNMVMDYLQKDAKIFIFDSNKDHLRLVESLGGNYININSKTPFSINPFSAINTDDDFREHIDYLIRFLYIIGVSSENTDDDLNENFRMHIVTALYALWEEKNKKIEITDIWQRLLRQNDKRLKPYINNLEHFSSEGKYGKFFTGESTFAFGDGLLTAIDLSDLAETKLKASIQAAVIIHLYRNFYYDSRQTVIFINQLKEFVKDLPNAHILIDPLYREARPHYISVVTAIESIKDLYDGDKISRTGIIILTNSEWKFFLPQFKIENSAKDMSDALYMHISDTEFNLIKSLKYNDAYIKSFANINGGVLLTIS